MKYKYLLFDMDGMLVDTSEGVFKCVAYALESFGIHTDRLETLKPFMGPPLSYSFKNFYGFSEEEAAEAVRLYRLRYTEKGQYECRVFDGVEEMLQKLTEKGYRLCIATSKLESYASSMLERLGIKAYFEIVTGSTVDETISTKEQVIEESIRRMGIEDRRLALMIGDRKYDVLGAKQSGLDSFGVYMGCAVPNEHEDACATYVANGIRELEEILLEM